MNIYMKKFLSKDFKHETNFYGNLITHSNTVLLPQYNNNLKYFTDYIYNTYLVYDLFIMNLTLRHIGVPFNNS